MHYIHNEYVKQEHVHYLDENQVLTRSWVNVSQAHEVEIIQAGFNFYVKVIFSPDQYYYVNSFDCEKAAVKYVKELLNE